MYGSVTALADNAAELIFVEYADHLWTSEFLLFFCHLNLKRRCFLRFVVCEREIESEREYRAVQYLRLCLSIFSLFVLIWPWSVVVAAVASASV